MPNDDYINYIKRSDAITEICRDCQMTEYCRMIGESCEDVKRIKAIPAANVEPVRHGRWIPHPGHHDFDLCSVCGTGTRRRIYEDGGEIEYNYRICPWCGAVMLPEPPKEDDDGADMAL